MKLNSCPLSSLQVEMRQRVNKIVFVSVHSPQEIICNAAHTDEDASYFFVVADISAVVNKIYIESFADILRAVYALNGKSVCVQRNAGIVHGALQPVLEVAGKVAIVAGFIRMPYKLMFPAELINVLTESFHSYIVEGVIFFPAVWQSSRQ